MARREVTDAQSDTKLKMPFGRRGGHSLTVEQRVVVPLARVRLPLATPNASYATQFL